MKENQVPYVIVFFSIVATAITLLMMGRVPICKCGYVKIWHGDNFSSESSQHLMDWYTPSHLIHGFLFFWFLYLVARQLSFGWRLVIATLLEAVWEISENTTAVIEHYRAVTISLDYFGDSVVNSVTDIVAMIVGFWLASKLPVWMSVAIVIGFEVLTMWLIRDGLALNVLMLLYPIEAVKVWQSGA